MQKLGEQPFQPKLLTRNTIALKRNSIPIDRRKIIADHDLQIKFEELKEFAQEMIVMQMAPIRSGRIAR